MTDAAAFLKPAIWVICLIAFLGMLSIYMYRKDSTKIFEYMSRHILPIALLVWIMGIMLYAVGLYGPGLNWFSVMPRAIVSSFKMFLLSESDFNKDLLGSNIQYMSWYSLMHLAAAFISFLFIFKMLGYKIKSSLKLLMHRWSVAGKQNSGENVHLFWGINEGSLLMAKDIKKHKSGDTIIFVDVDNEQAQDGEGQTSLTRLANTITATSSEIEGLEELDALVDHCFNGPDFYNNTSSKIDIFGELGLNNIKHIVAASASTNFYFFSDDEEKNILGGLSLKKDSTLALGPEEKYRIFIHASKSAGHEILDSHSMKLIDSSYLSVAMLKMEGNEDCLPVNSVTADTSTGLVNDKEFISFVIGFGTTGREALKFLYEFSAFIEKDGKIPFKCYAFDKNMDQMEGYFRNSIHLGDDELCLVNASSDSKIFWDTYHQLVCRLNQIIITIKDDNKALSLAVNLLKHAIRYRTGKNELKILVRCYENHNESRMQTVVDNLNNSVKGCGAKIYIFGQESMLYTCDMILSDKILDDAMIFNYEYAKTSPDQDKKLEATPLDQWKKDFGKAAVEKLQKDKGISLHHAVTEINRQMEQNISNSLHKSTKMALMGLNNKNVKHFAELIQSRDARSTDYTKASDAEKILLHNLARSEKERWNASHKLMGYTYAPKKHYVLLHHTGIDQWDKFDECTRSYDCNVVDTTIKLSQTDGE